MKRNYYKETYRFYNSMSNKDLNYILSDYLEETESELKYYTNILKRAINDSKYNDIICRLSSLSESIYDIKIILRIIYERSKKY